MSRNFILITRYYPDVGSSFQFVRAVKGRSVLISDFLYVRLNKLEYVFYIFGFLFLYALSDTLCPLVDYE